MRTAVVGLGVAALGLLVHGDAPPRTPETVEVQYCGSYVPLTGLTLEEAAGPLPESSTTSCQRLLLRRYR